MALDPQDTICLQCGNRGIPNAFVYCVRCLDFAVHRYCLDTIPKTCDEYVPWYCGCEVKRKNKTVALKHNVIPSERGVHEVSERINGVSGVTKEKSHMVAVKIEPQVCEDYPQLLCDISAQHDLIKCAESNKISPLEFREMDNTHEEIKGQQPNSSLQVDVENNDALIKCASSSYEISLKEMVNEKRSVIIKPSVKKDRNGLVKDITDCTVPAVVKKSDDTLMKCTSPSDDISLKEMVNKSVIVEPSAEKYQNRPVNDATMAPILDSHARPEPIIRPVWRGGFNILHKKLEILNEMMAHLSTKACQKVYQEAQQLQPVLHLEMLPKSDIWPKSFQASEPSAENIALYFFPSKTSERIFDRLVDKMIRGELGMRAIVQNAELLVFPSNELPLGYWMFQSKYYLWGVFRGKQPTPSHSQSGVGESGDRIGIPSDLSTGDKTLVKTTKNCDPRSPQSPLSNSGSGGNGSRNC